MAPLVALPNWQTPWNGAPGVSTPLGPLQLRLGVDSDRTAPVMLRWRRGGEVLDLPPLHMHHFHLYQGDRVGLRAPFTHYLLSETHGDSSCSRSGAASA